MKLSERKRQKLYEAIYNQITDLRVKLKTDNPKPDEELDFELAKLIRRIWDDVKRSLDIVE